MTAKAPVLMQYGNQLIDIREFRAEHVRPFEIASSLGNLCRWNGWTRGYYSVAEHSIRVAEHVPYEHRAWAILHDAAEAYLGDLSTPIKRVCPEFAELEAIIMRAVCDRFDLSPDMPGPVYDADQRMLATEARDCLRSPPLWTATHAPYAEPMVRVGMLPSVASQAWYEHLRYALPHGSLPHAWGGGSL